MKRTTRVVVVLALPGMLWLASCSSDKRKPSAQSSSSAPPTTAPPPVFPLTGLLAPGGPPTRPALSIKIDNVPPALPQAGINNADIVTEELVEGGQTRLFVTFHSQDADPVGPIRSARPVDADLLSELGGGLFAFSGAAPGEIAPVEEHSGATLLSNDAGISAFYREPSRSAPHNVFSSTPALYAAGTEAGDHSPPPPARFHYGDSTGRAVSNVSFVMGERLNAAWHWNPTATHYERDQNGAADVTTDGSPVAATNVLIMSVKIEGSGVFDSIGEEDPFVVVTGENPCFLLRDGQVIEGRWSRPSFDKPTVFKDTKGNELRFHPGRTWVELLPDSQQPTFS